MRRQSGHNTTMTLTNIVGLRSIRPGTKTVIHGLGHNHRDVLSYLRIPSHQFSTMFRKPER